MATAYAALVSLINTIAMERSSGLSYPPISFDRVLIDALLERIEFFVQFLEQGWKGAEYLEGRITDLVYAAEDAIESPIVDTVLAGWASSSSNDRRPVPTSQRLVGNLKYFSCIRFLVEFLEQCWKGAEHLEGPVLTGQGLEAIIEDLDSIKAVMMQIKDKCRNTDRESSRSAIGSSSAPHGEKNKMVGFEKEKIRIMEELEGMEPRRQIVSIHGMGGIGKTTLAQTVYDHKRIVDYFDVRAWVTVSQDYNAKEMLKEFLSGLKNHESNDMDSQEYNAKEMLREVLSGLKNRGNDEMDEELLGETVHKSLFGRRYLVIFDDIWNINAWYNISRFLPENYNGSRIILTTRLFNLAYEVSTFSLGMKPLDEDSSWKLLCEKVFGQGSCPLELKRVGKRIAKNCRGLPLTIAVIGGLLAKSNLKLEYWNGLAEDFSSYLNDDDHCSKILSLSYNHLPIHLKPCFLCMGIFPEDHEISVSELTNLWIAEGFLKSHEGKTFEEIAEEYLKDLVERNLIVMVPKNEIFEKEESCTIHDLLRELCMKEAEKDCFFCVVTRNSLSVPVSLCCQRRLVVQLNKVDMIRDIGQIIIDFLPSASRVRSLVLNFHMSFLKFYEYHIFKLLRVLFVINESDIEDDEWEATSNLVNLRYLKCPCDSESSSKFFSNMRLFRNMQMLELGSAMVFRNMQMLETDYKLSEVDIWSWPQVRHVKLSATSLLVLPSCPPEDYIILENNLQTLEGVLNFKFDEAVCKRICNVKALSLCYSESTRGFMMHNLGQLQKLESFSLNFCGSVPEFCCTQHGPYRLLRSIVFPHSIKELYLRRSSCSWEEMTVIGSLPNLELLLLEEMSFTGPEWNPVEGEFLHLKFLLMASIEDLVYWNAEHTHFPCLEKLTILDLHKLEKIPLDIGEIPTLRLITLMNCRNSVAISAKNILDEQQNLGNETLVVNMFNS